LFGSPEPKIPSQELQSFVASLPFDLLRPIVAIVRLFSAANILVVFLSFVSLTANIGTFPFCDIMLVLVAKNEDPLIAVVCGKDCNILRITRSYKRSATGPSKRRKLHDNDDSNDFSSSSRSSNSGSSSSSDSDADDDHDDATDAQSVIRIEVEQTLRFEADILSVAMNPLLHGPEVVVATVDCAIYVWEGQAKPHLCVSIL
jgi:hypothetical protein